MWTTHALSSWPSLILSIFFCTFEEQKVLQRFDRQLPVKNGLSYLVLLQMYRAAETNRDYTHCLVTIGWHKNWIRSWHWARELVIQSCWQHSCQIQILQTRLLLKEPERSQEKGPPLKSHLLRNYIRKEDSWMCRAGFVLAAPQKSLFTGCSQLHVMGIFHFSLKKNSQLISR